MNSKKVMPVVSALALVVALMVGVYGSAAASPNTSQTVNSSVKLDVAALEKDQVGKAAVNSNLDIFVKIDGIEGDSNDDRHANEIEVLSFGQGLSQTLISNRGGGGGFGKAKFSDVSFRHPIDSASVKLMVASASGEHIKSATFSFRKPGQNQDYYKVTLSNVLISAVNQVGSTGEQGPLSFDDLKASSNATGLLEEVKLNFTKIEWIFYPQKADGSLGAPIKGGWDLEKNGKV
jgi:type VI secretion system secreted protein Hcp